MLLLFFLSFLSHIFTQRWISHKTLDGLFFEEKKDFTLCFLWKLRVRSFEFRFVDFARTGRKKTTERSLGTTTWDLDVPFFFHILRLFRFGRYIVLANTNVIIVALIMV